MTRLKLATSETFRSLGVRNFRVFFIGQAISQVGTWLQFIAQALLVLQLTDSGVALGLVTAFQFLPVLVFGAWAGVISDRVDKRKLMLVTQTAMMVFALVLGLFVLSGHITVIGVYVLAALTGTANAFDNPSRRVMITELVDEARHGERREPQQRAHHRLPSRRSRARGVAHPQRRHRLVLRRQRRVVRRDARRAADDPSR